MFVIVLFHLCPHESLRVWNFNTFLQKCSFVQDCTSSFLYRFHFTLLYLHHPSLCFCHCLHLMACYTFKCTFVDNYSPFVTMSSSPVSFCIVYASTKCCSSTLSSTDSLMHIGSTNVAPSLVCSLPCQHCLFLRKNSTIDVPVVYVLNYHLHKLYLLIICLPFCTF